MIIRNCEVDSAIELLTRRVFGLHVVDPRTTVAAPTRFEVKPWLREHAFTAMKCKVFNNDLRQSCIE